MRIFSLLFLIIIFFNLNPNKALSQFTVYTPPNAFSISDIEYSNSLSEVVLATNAGVYFFDGVNWTTTTTIDGLPSNDVKCLSNTNTGDVLTSTASGLAKWNGLSWDAYIVNSTQSYAYISSIYILAAPDTMYGTNNGKLLRKGSSALATNVPMSPPVGLFTHIGHMDPPGAYNFAIGTTTNGAVIYDIPTTSTFIVNTSSTPIPSNNILSHDIEGNKTYDGTDQGVYIPDFTNFPSMTSIIYNTSNSQLPSNIVQAVAVRNGVQWYGTPNGLANLQGSTWTIYNTANSNLPDNDVVELAYDMIGNVIWIGTADGNLSMLDLSVGIDNKNNNYESFKIHPNPVNSNLFIESEQKVKQVSIFDISGKQMDNYQFRSGLVQVEHLPKGIYFIQLISKDEVATKKFIKQ